MKSNEEFVRSFREVQPKFSRLMTRLLVGARLTLPQYALLNQLLVHGTLPMSDVSCKLHISKPAITNLVDRLEKNKYLKRMPHSSDRRISLLQMLPKGEKTLRRMQAEVLKFLLATLEKFNSREQKVINRFYLLLSQTMDEVLTAEGGRKRNEQ